MSLIFYVETTVENRTGGAIQLLDVDYPSASFGANSLVAGAVFRYRIQVRGNGPLNVTYTGSDAQQVQIEGPALAERQAVSAPCSGRAAIAAGC
jgi:hypothetical protein